MADKSTPYVPSWFALTVHPQLRSDLGIDRHRELVYRDRYGCEREVTVDFDGVPWPVDLGEAGA